MHAALSFIDRLICASFLLAVSERFSCMFRGWRSGGWNVPWIVALLWVALAPSAAHASLTWTKQSSNTTYNLTHVVFGGGQFVAVGAHGTILTSPDGNTWTPRVATNQGIPIIDDLGPIAYGNGTYVIVRANYVLTSSDGVNWTKHNLQFCNVQGYCAANTPRGIAYGNGHFVIVGATQGINGYAYYLIQTSTDGINWSDAGTGGTSANAGAYGWRSVAFGNGRFIAVNGSQADVSTSTDGISWNLVTPTTFRPPAYSVAYGTNGFLMVNSSGTFYLCTNGCDTFDNWNHTYSGASGAMDTDVRYAGGYYFAQLYNMGTSRYITQDGISFVSINFPLFNDIAYGNGNIVNIGNRGAIYTAPSQISLTSQTIGTISFSPATLAVGGTTTASATATSGLAVTYTSTTPSVCSVSGSTITGVKAGTCTIAANQAGNAGYSAAPQVTQNITIGTASQTPISDARVFAYAEANYPGLFSGTVTSGQYQQYDYRYYLNNRIYLAIDTTGMVYIMGPTTGGAITPVGTVASFANLITAWEARRTGSGNSSSGGSTTSPLPSGYISQGGLTWMPVSSTLYTYAGAAALCAGAINGQTGWRLPTKDELVSLYTSGAMNGQGWTLYNTWSSTLSGSHYGVNLSIGSVYTTGDTFDNYVTCVRSDSGTSSSGGGSNSGSGASSSGGSTTSTLPSGYVSQGGLTWMPVSSTVYIYAQATALCAGAINGQTGWRLPTYTELVSLYKSGAMNGQGWRLDMTWSSTPDGFGDHYVVNLDDGSVGLLGLIDYNTIYGDVTCVR